MKKLYKSRNDAKIAGVCGGLAKYLNADPTVVRLITAAVSLTGIGLLPYIVAAVIMPQEPEGYEPEDENKDQYVDYRNNNGN